MLGLAAVLGWWENESAMLRIAAIVLACLFVGCLLLVLALVAMRLGFDVLHRRREARAARLRSLFFQLVMGEPRDALEAERTLQRMRPREWAFARRQAFGMLPKLRGESRDHLIRVLRAKGGVATALAQVSSVSLVQRCHGAFALGALRERGHVEVLLDLLGDPAFLVRRVAVRALGNIGEAVAVPALLELGREEPRLSRDLIYALHRIGPEGTTQMRDHLHEAIASEAVDRSGELVATVLGALGDYPSRHILIKGLGSEWPGLSAACADTLGENSAPDTESALIEALTHPSARVRAAAAQALGSLGSSEAVEPLAALVEADEHIGSREAASALVSLGTPGRARLAQSPSAYAIEALTLADLRRSR